MPPQAECSRVWLYQYARDGHQPLDLWPLQRDPSDLAIQRRNLSIEEVDLAQAPVESETFIDRELQLRKPRPAGFAKRVGDRWRKRDELVAA